MNKPSLVSIDNELKEIYYSIEQHGGEISPEYEEKISELLVQSKEKVSSYCFILDSMDNEIAFVEQQIKQAKEYVDKIEKQQTRLKEIAMSVINKNEKSKLEGINGRYLSKRKSQSVIIEDDSVIDSMYLKITTSVDKSKIKDDLKSGVEVSGAKLVNNENLTWK
jgi:hypothetical protein